LYSSTGKSFASLGFMQVRYLIEFKPEGMIVNIRKFVPLEVPDKAFQIPFNFRDFLKFDEFLNIKLKNVNVKRMPCKLQVVQTHFSSVDDLFPIPSKNFITSMYRDL
jgi:hypothetical protein